MRFLRANGYRTYIVTGGGQAFVRAYVERVYGIRPEQGIGSALETPWGLWSLAIPVGVLLVLTVLFARPVRPAVSAAP